MTTQLKTGEDIYNYIQSNTKNKSEVIEALGKMTAIQKDEYKKYQAKLRQKKFYKANKQELQERNRANFKNYVAKNADKWKDMNLKHQKEYQEREKQKLEAEKKLIEQKAKTRTEAKEIANSIINDLIGDTITEVGKKQKRTYMKNYMREYRKNNK
jgi:hypothetical protein